MIIRDSFSADSSSSENSNENIRNILTAEELSLPLNELLEKFPTKYHRNLIKFFKKKADSTYLHFNGFSINRNHLPALHIQPQELNCSIKYLTRINKHIDNFKFNDFQIAAINQVLKSKSKNFIISAPTASGKTYLTLFFYYRHGKMIYVVPLKALIRDLVVFFNQFNLRVRVNSGDEISKNWKHFDVLIVTPEKLDLLINNEAWLKKVKTLIFDEIHILNDSRGPVIESIYTKIKFLKLEIKVLALSATISNTEAVCQFLDAELVEYSNYRKNDITIDYIENVSVSEYCVVFNLLKMKSQNEKKVLIFVDSRAETHKLLCNIFVNVISVSLKNELRKVGVSSFYEKYFLEMKTKGLIVHHAGLSRQERKIDDNWSLIVATNTLAWGVNINPDLVIIKSEFDYLNIIQMQGRVSRIKSGRAIIFKQKHPNLNIKSRMNENFDFWVLNFINFLSLTACKEAKDVDLCQLQTNEGDFEYKMFLYYVKNNISVYTLKIIQKEELIQLLENWYINTFSFKCKDDLNLDFMKIINIFRKYFLLRVIDEKEHFIVSPLLNIAYKNGFTVCETLKIYKEMNHASCLRIYFSSLMSNFSFYKNYLNLQFTESSVEKQSENMVHTNIYERLKSGEFKQNPEFIKYILRHLEMIKEISIFKQNSDILIETYIFLGKHVVEKKLKDCSVKKNIVNFNREENMFIFKGAVPLKCYLVVFSSGRIHKHEVIRRYEINKNKVFKNPLFRNNNVVIFDKNFQLIFKDYLLKV